jgi:peptidoglycan/LPS O-acetylase OafA/YrhL
MPDKNNLQVLDSIRGAAAIYVVLHHWLPHLSSVPKWISKGVFAFGQESVMLFFLLSGFVIGLSCFRTSNMTFRNYFLKRFRRIYFPFIIAILLSTLIAFIQGYFIKDFSLAELIGNLFMLQDISFIKPGTWFEPFLGNLSLWSLTYEWWFYMLFFAIYKLAFRSPYRFYGIAALSIIAYSIYWIYPNQISLILTYFTIWWSGIELADLYFHKEKFNIVNLKPILIILGGLSVISFIPVFRAESIQFGLYPFLIFRHFFVSLLFVFLVWIVIHFKLDKHNNIIAPFSKISPISYGLYIFHFPLLIQFQGFPFVSPFFNEVFKALLLLVLAFLVEIKFQPIVNRLIR